MSEDGTPVVVVVDTPVVDSVLGLGLPSVGERIIRDLMLLSFLFGIAMVGIGSVILSRNRT